MRGYIFYVVLTLYGLFDNADSVENIKRNDKITYVQIKPLVNVQPPRNAESFRSSRIENIPLQIKALPTHPTKNPPEPPVPLTEFIRTPRSEDKAKLQEASTELSGQTDYIDRDNESEARFDTSEAEVPNSEDDADLVESSSAGSNNRISTSHDNDLFKFYPKNKLKTYGPKKYYGNLESVNPGYRKYLESRRFRSRCRCERIWNCPKLQISVPRCPEEYFLCCF